jgi:hypothetical protein
MRRSLCCAAVAAFALLALTGMAAAAVAEVRLATCVWVEARHPKPGPGCAPRCLHRVACLTRAGRGSACDAWYCSWRGR